MSVNHDRAKLLLNVVDLANQWPNLKPLHDIAMAELEDMAQEAAKTLADAKAKAEAEQAKAAAEAKAKADAKAKEESPPEEKAA